MKNKLFAIVFLWALSFFFSLALGSVSIFDLPKHDVMTLLFDIRLPRVLSICFVGFTLGFSGFILQSLLQNPLAEPYTLGLSGGASVGVSIAILFSLYPLWLSLPLLAAISCLLVTILIFMISKRLGGWNQKSLILSGIVISYFCNSFSYVSVSALKPEDLGLALKWLMGRFGEDRDSWWPFLAICFFISYYYMYVKKEQLEKYHLGENLSLPFAFRSNTRAVTLVLISILTAISVSIAGVIAFVGLMAPHIATLILKTVRFKYLLPASSLLGATLLLVSDLVARLLFPFTDIPAGGIVAVVGSPYLLYYLLKGSNDWLQKS